jgi:hypothetical protein
LTEADEKRRDSLPIDARSLSEAMSEKAHRPIIPKPCLETTPSQSPRKKSERKSTEKKAISALKKVMRRRTSKLLSNVPDISIKNLDSVSPRPTERKGKKESAKSIKE